MYKIKTIGPNNFSLEKSTIWSFPERGKWATHNGNYRGNWSPYIPRNVILRYSNDKDLVLDQFVGSGTTLIEAKLLNRNAIGVDVNLTSIRECNNKCKFEFNGGRVEARYGDARNLQFIEDSSIDLICTHPPYANIIKYSNADGDLSQFDILDFIDEMVKVAKESFRVLKKEKYCAILMGDLRKKGSVIPLGFMVKNTFEEGGFSLKEIIIKTQHNCSSTSKWLTTSEKNNFLLLAHEYLFIFKK